MLQIVLYASKWDKSFTGRAYGSNTDSFVLQFFLKPFKAQRFAPMDDADYDVVRDLAKILNLDLSTM